MELFYNVGYWQRTRVHRARQRAERGKKSNPGKTPKVVQVSFQGDVVEVHPPNHISNWPKAGFLKQLCTWIGINIVELMNQHRFRWASGIVCILCIDKQTSGFYTTAGSCMLECNLVCCKFLMLCLARSLRSKCCLTSGFYLCWWRWDACFSHRGQCSIIPKHVTATGGSALVSLGTIFHFFMQWKMHILIEWSSCSFLEKSDSFISCGTDSAGCFLCKPMAFSTLADVLTLIFGMFVTHSYTQVAI